MFICATIRLNAGADEAGGAVEHELARRRIEAPDEIIDWAKRDSRWSFTLAEIMNEPVAMQRELAARLLVAIVDELEQEREAFGEAVDGNAEISGALSAD